MSRRIFQMFSILSQRTECPFSVLAAQDAHNGRDSARGVRAAPAPARDRERRVGDQADRLRQPFRVPPASRLLPPLFSASYLHSSASSLLALLLCLFALARIPTFPCTDGHNCSLLYFLCSFALHASGFAFGFGADLRSRLSSACTSTNAKCSRDCQADRGARCLFCEYSTAR